MTAQEFGALLVVATAMASTPGRHTTLSTALAANHGLRGALPFCFAVPAGWSLLMAWMLAVMLVYAFVSNFLYALVGALLRRWLAQGERLPWFTRTLGALLAATAVWMAFS
jgi:threonine/homoserine/homoserine lactone efflux protein